MVWRGHCSIMLCQIEKHNQQGPPALLVFLFDKEYFMELMKWAPDEGHNDVVYVYLMTNDINGKKYVGISWNPPGRWEDHFHENDDLKGARLITKALRKYGFRNFTKEVVAVGDRSEAGALEKELINHMNTLLPNGYNMAEGGTGGKTCSNFKHKPETIDRIKATKAAKSEEEKAETSRRLSASNTGKKRTAAQRAAISKRRSGSKRSKESIERFRRTMAAKTPEEKNEIGRKLSKANTGKKRSEEFCRRASERLKGKPQNLTEEQRRRKSEAQRGRSPWNKGKRMTEGEKRIAREKRNYSYTASKQRTFPSEDIITILKMFHKQGKRITEISREYKKDKMTIKNIVNGVSYREITLPWLVTHTSGSQGSPTSPPQ